MDNQQQTKLAGIQLANPNHPLVNGFLSASKHAQQNYQSDAVLITFNCGKSNVIHMISHFYLQHSETRDTHHQMSAKQFAIDIKASTVVRNLVANQGQHINYAEIQSSSTLE
ncbi:unnamed protein product [Rotaria sp. Silwood2]|nr:unnamed protein product [Rotaria sp. Silwood2]CAF3148148.1 unnamed protein product [Rotaria sp. Silwood2]CAF4497245.1 unnamed protein product [Rotaria sp. Silwood2]CAF4527093.1 unnamed protein product [Rotaria sp. Silwood2]